MMVEPGDGTSPGSLPNEERERSGDGLILSQESSCRHERGFKRFPGADGTTPGVVDSGNLRVPPTRRLPEPSSVHDLTVKGSEDDENDATFKPPVSVIVIQNKPPPTARQDSLAAGSGRLLRGACPFLLSPSGAAGGAAGDGFSPFITSHVTSSSSMGSTSRIITANSTPARPRAASLSSASASSPFRLQPRNPPKLGPSTAVSSMHAYGSPPRSSMMSHRKGGPSANVNVAGSSSMISLHMSGNSHRGRKRRAHSMSTYPEPSLVAAAAAAAAATTTPTTTALHGKSPIKATRGGAEALQGTPPRFTCTKPSPGYTLGGGTPGNSIATETTVRESLLGTPLQDANTNSPTSSTATPASTPGRVLPTAATPHGTAAASSTTWYSGPHKPKPSEAAFGADASGSSPGAASVHMMNFQGLSLLSPPRSGAVHPVIGDGGSSLDGSCAASPASSLHGSQASHARSCFSKYQHYPHPHGAGVYGAEGHSAAAHRVQSNHPHVLSPQSSSTPRSVAGGSPRIAPLIVLGGPKSWYTGSASAAGGSTMGAPAPPNNVTAQLESAAALMDAANLEAAAMHKATTRAGGSPRRAFVPSPDAANQKKRPPLHQQHRGSSPYASAVLAAAPPSVNWMHSLDGSAADEDDDPMPPAHSLPPSTVLCHPSTPGSTLSQDAQPSRFLKAAAKSFPAASSLVTSRKGSDAVQDEDMPGAPSEADTATGMATPCRGGGKLRRSPDESPGKRSVTSMSPTSTPLPRLSLTPRSTTSSHAARQLFLSLPTPSDLAGNGGFDVSLAAAGAPAPPSSALPSPRRNSYIPLPDWASSEPYETSMGSAEASSIFENQSQRRGLPSSHPPAASAALLSTSLLSPPSPNDAIERFLKDSSFSAGATHPGGAECVNMGATGHDDDSLSASDDDDEAFFLATPLAIHEEKQSSLQQSKQRKLREQSYTSSRSQHSLASSNIMQASSTSLRGMNFVTSSTSLDKIGSKASSGAPCLPQSFTSLKRQDSQTSIGLTLEGTNAPSSEESAAKDPNATGGRSSSSFSRSAATTTPTCFARDLVTPPVMAQPKSPPPLPSPRIPTATTAAAALPRSLPNHRGQRCEDLMELDGADWSPTTSPPPSTSSRHRWPCAGEAESPMDPYTTRVFYSSTAPDGSPSD